MKPKSMIISLVAYVFIFDLIIYLVQSANGELCMSTSCFVQWFITIPLIGGIVAVLTQHLVLLQTKKADNKK